MEACGVEESFTTRPRLRAITASSAKSKASRKNARGMLTLTPARTPSISAPSLLSKVVLNTSINYEYMQPNIIFHQRAIATRQKTASWVVQGGHAISQQDQWQKRSDLEDCN
jgi:hypothetical protein